MSVAPTTQVIRGALNLAAECLRRGRGWTRFNTFTQRIEFRYVTITERETTKTSWEDDRLGNRFRTVTASLADVDDESSGCHSSDTFRGDTVVWASHLTIRLIWMFHVSSLQNGPKCVAKRVQSAEL